MRRNMEEAGGPKRVQELLRDGGSELDDQGFNLLPDGGVTKCVENLLFDVYDQGRSPSRDVAHIPVPLIPLSAGDTRVFLADTVYVRDERFFSALRAAGAGWPLSREPSPAPRLRWDFIPAPNGGQTSADFSPLRRGRNPLVNMRLPER